MYSFGK